MKTTATIRYKELIFTPEERELLLNLNKIANDISTDTERWHGDVLEELLENIEIGKLSEKGYVVNISSLYDII